MTLYILSGWNNYYNRLIKFIDWDNVEEWDPSIVHRLEQTNFNPNDGVTTTHVIGNGDYDGRGDYLLAMNDDNEIVSRWFIINSERTRAGQYQLTLKRDVIVDYYNIINEGGIAFIEKADLDVNSPFIFNEEEMTTNQIKTTEYLLKDELGCPWIIGYYDRNKINEMNGTVATNDIIPGSIQLTEDIENWEYYDYSNLSSTSKILQSLPTLLEYGIRTRHSGPSVENQKYDFYLRSSGESVGWNTKRERDDGRAILSFPAGTDFEPDVCNAILKSLNDNVSGGINTLNSSVDSFVPGLTTQLEFDSFYTFNGKIIRDAQGRYYQVEVKQEPTGEKAVYTDIKAGSLFNNMSKIVAGASYNLRGTPDQNSFFVYHKYYEYKFYLTRLENLETKYNIPASSLITTDAPWNIFAIPYGDVMFIPEVGSDYIATNKEIAMQCAMSMQQQHPGIIYDIQLLPYCPMPNQISDDIQFQEYYGKKAIEATDSREYSIITSGTGDDEKKVGVIFNVTSSNFTTNLFKEIKSGNTNIEKKVNSQCDKWRLASPNYSNYFDFSVEKNGGIQYFNVDCNYKPFTPYIHINPNFGNLYGYDDNSPRGLVLGGDFSLSQIIDQWQQYQVQNKNFQNIFDRQIQNMEVQNKYQRINDIASAVVGTVQGTATGAMTGSLYGGVPGAVVGGVVGGVSSLAGGIADYRIKEQLRNEAIDYTKDQFGYQLGNIQALPNTISKVSAFNENNKIFPVLEYYTCTEEEKKAVRMKCALNGMTTMVVDSISNYWSNSLWYEDYEQYSRGYFKCKLIHCPSVANYKIYNEISSELYKGVYRRL